MRWKATILFLITMTWVVLTPVLAMAAPISIPDPNLEAAVRSAINKPGGEIDLSDVQNLTQLDASGRGISSVEGLQYFTNLRVLWLYDNPISDISPLRNLTRLNTLGLCNDRVSDISPLSGMTQLTFLSLYNNRVSDISALRNMKKLKTLKLAGDPIADYSPIADIYNQLEVKDFTLPANQNPPAGTAGSGSTAGEGASNPAAAGDPGSGSAGTADNGTGNQGSSISNTGTGSSPGAGSSGSVNIASQDANTGHNNSLSASLRNMLEVLGSNLVFNNSLKIMLLVGICLAAGLGWWIFRKTGSK